MMIEYGVFAFFTSSYTNVAFSALTLLAGEQEGIQPNKYLPTNPKGSRFGLETKLKLE